MLEDYFDAPFQGIFPFLVETIPKAIFIGLVFYIWWFIKKLTRKK